MMMQGIPAMLTRCTQALLTSILILIQMWPLTVGASAAEEPDFSIPPKVEQDPRYGLLTPLPDHGPLPPIVELANTPSPEELEHRAKVRGYEQQLRQIRRKHFGRMRASAIRAAGLAQLREFTDPAAFRPMLEILSGEKDDVRLAMLDHFAACADEGQAALAWVAIADADDAMRAEATRRMVTPPSRPVLWVLDQALRSRYHRTANNAGTLAATLRAAETIPLLIFSQVTADRKPENRGDIAWIAITTQQPYVVNLRPAVGNNVAAYQPVLGLVSEGCVLRVMDAVVVVYRTEVHRALVNLTTRDWGRSTEHLGYDVAAWWRWYNAQYTPFKNEQARLAELAGPVEPPTNRQDETTP